MWIDVSNLDTLTEKRSPRPETGARGGTLIFLEQE